LDRKTPSRFCSFAGPERRFVLRDNFAAQIICFEILKIGRRRAPCTNPAIGSENPTVRTGDNSLFALFRLCRVGQRATLVDVPNQFG